jgi:hypothetical protein
MMTWLPLALSMGMPESAQQGESPTPTELERMKFGVVQLEFEL